MMVAASVQQTNAGVAIILSSPRTQQHNIKKKMKLANILATLLAILAEALGVNRADVEKIKELGSDFQKNLLDLKTELGGDVGPDAIASEDIARLVETANVAFAGTCAVKPPIEQNLADVAKILAEVPAPACQCAKPEVHVPPASELKFGGGKSDDNGGGPDGQQ